MFERTSIKFSFDSDLIRWNGFQTTSNRKQSFGFHEICSTTPLAIYQMLTVKQSQGFSNYLARTERRTAAVQLFPRGSKILRGINKSSAGSYGAESNCCPRRDQRAGKFSNLDPADREVKIERKWGWILNHPGNSLLPGFRFPRDYLAVRAASGRISKTFRWKPSTIGKVSRFFAPRDSLPLLFLRRNISYKRAKGNPR